MHVLGDPEESAGVGESAQYHGTKVVVRISDECTGLQAAVDTIVLRCHLFTLSAGVACDPRP